MIKLFVTLLFYGHVGLLIEVWFTSIHAIFVDKDNRAPGRTYLWMIPVYAIGATLLDHMRDISGNLFQFTINAISAIYAVEFISGWILRKILGRCPWDYGQAQYGVLGLIRVDYLPYWALAAVFFYQFSEKITTMLDRVTALL